MKGAHRIHTRASGERTGPVPVEHPTDRGLQQRAARRTHSVGVNVGPLRCRARARPLQSLRQSLVTLFVDDITPEALRTSEDHAPGTAEPSAKLITGETSLLAV